MSKEVVNGIHNTMQSIWDYNPAISSNNPQLGYSNFELMHEFRLGSSNRQGQLGLKYTF